MKQRSRRQERCVKRSTGSSQKVRFKSKGGMGCNCNQRRSCTANWVLQPAMLEPRLPMIRRGEDKLGSEWDS
jgi:hypothetical protein